jgi:thiol-disulfide isomerase/thioredoxin
MRRIAGASSCVLLVFALIRLTLAVTEDSRATSLPEGQGSRVLLAPHATPTFACATQPPSSPESPRDRKQPVEKPRGEKRPGDKQPSEKPSSSKPDSAGSSKPNRPRDEESPASRLIDDPDNLELLRRFVGDEMRQLTRMVQENPAQAIERIAELKVVFKEIRPTKRQVQHELGHAKASLGIYEKQIAYSKVTLAQAGQNWQKKPDDVEAIMGYFAKLTGEIYRHSRDKSDEAEKQLDAARELVKSMEPQVKSEAARKQLSWSTRSMDRLQGVVAAGKRLEQIVGEEAIPLEMDAWVNGTPATSDATRGKVVLIAFWAVWSSPCVSTFPRLRDWHAKYEDRGLVMVGATRYYNFRWDDKAKRANRSFGPVSRTSEREMLTQFARHHDLPFVVGVQAAGGPIGKHYGVIELPHFVVIDAAGVVRFAKGGSDPRITTEVDKLLNELMAAR